MCENPKYAIKKRYNSFSLMTKNTTKARIIFVSEEEYYKNKEKDYYVIIPCKKCKICRIAYANEWATRCYCELVTNPNAIFVTLSYNNENLPKNKYGKQTLRKQDITDFKKRLRQHLYRKTGNRIKIKTFECGEYGEKKGRPHYHMIIWGYRPEDMKIRKLNKQQQPLYTSEEIEKLWGKGFTIIGNVSYESASYVARYTQKKINEIDKRNKGREQSYINMSRSDGVGLQFWQSQNASIKKNKGIYIPTRKGVKLRNIPKYYMKKWEEEITGENKRELEQMTEAMNEDYEYLQEIKRETLEETRAPIKLWEMLGDREKAKEIKRRRKEYLENETIKKHNKWIKEIKEIIEKNEMWVTEWEKSEIEKWKWENRINMIIEKKKIMENTSLTEKDYDKQHIRLLKDRGKMLKRELEKEYLTIL